MKLRTSFFNIRVLRKNLARFAPLWILFAVAEVLGLMTLDLTGPAYRIVRDLEYILGTVSIFHAGYAFVVAACLFGDLFDSRMCNGLHAMPMKREGWLLTNLLSGLIFALIPAVVAGGVAAVILREYWWIAIVWQGSSLLQFLFFFGLAVFSAMCAGKKLGMAAVYGILNFLSMLIYWVATKIYEPLLLGVVLSDDWFKLFCPVITMVGSQYYHINITVTETMTTAVFEGYNLNEWYYLFICAGLGAVFTLLAWLLYRKRHLETAGDLISFRPMRGFFLLAYTMAAGVIVYSVDELFGTETSYAFLVVGILVGWFTGWMLLERTVKIFSGKVLAWFAAFAVLLGGSLGLTAMDPLGITTYVPDAQQIEKANVYMMGDRFYYERDEGWAGRYITDPAEIAQVQDLHKQMLDAAVDTNSEQTIVVYVRYELKNGFHVLREYYVPAQSQAGQSLKSFFSDLRSVLSVDDIGEVKDTLQYAYVYLNEDGSDGIMLEKPEQLKKLMEALRADSEAGVLAQDHRFHENENSYGGIDMTWWATWDDGRASGTRGGYIVIYEDCVNTIAFLNTLK